MSINVLYSDDKAIRMLDKNHSRMQRNERSNNRFTDWSFCSPDVIKGLRVSHYVFANYCGFVKIDYLHD